MSIRIFSKKTFAIGPGVKRGSMTADYFHTIPLSFQDMPEKYANDRTFKLAVKAGDITIVENGENAVKQQIVAPATPVTPDPATPKAAYPDADKTKVADPDVDSIEAYKEQLKKMNKEEVKAEAEKYGAEFVEDDKLSQNKKRVLEAYKIAE